MNLLPNRGLDFRRAHGRTPCQLPGFVRVLHRPENRGTISPEVRKNPWALTTGPGLPPPRSSSSGQSAHMTRTHRPSDRPAHRGPAHPPPPSAGVCRRPARPSGRQQRPRVCNQIGRRRHSRGRSRTRCPHPHHCSRRHSRRTQSDSFQPYAPTKSRIDLSVGKLANITFYLLTSPVLGPRDLVYRSRFHGPISLAGGVGSSMPHCMALPPKPLRNQKAQARPELLTIAEEVKTKLATSATGLANANCAGCATPWTEEGLSRSRRS